MLMENSSRVSLIKKVRAFFLGILVALAVITLLANLVAWGVKGRFKGALSDELPQEYSVGAMFYLPPHFFIFKNISLSPPNQSRDPILRLSWVTSRVALRESIRARTFVFRDIFCYGVHSPNDKLSAFLRDNLDEVMAYLNNLPLRDMNLGIQNASVILVSPEGTRNRFSTGLHISVIGDAVRARGMLEVSAADTHNKRLHNTMPVQYDLHLRARPAGFSLESIELSRENFYVKTWGKLEKEVLLLSGFMFIDTSFEEKDFDRWRRSLAVRIMQFVSRRSFSFPRLELVDADLLVLDVDGRIKMSFPEIDVERLKFSVNNLPVEASGKILLGETALLDCQVFADFSKLRAYEYTGNLQKIHAGWKGSFHRMLASGNGYLSFFFSPSMGSQSAQELSLRLNQGSMRFSSLGLQRFSFGSIDVLYSSPSNTSRALLEGVRFALKHRGEKAYSMGLVSRFNEGTLHARSIIDIDEYPPRIESTIRVRNAQAERLRDLFVHFTKVDGRLFSQMNFKNRPSFRLKGGAFIRGGYLRDFEFFKWLADQFQIPSLRRVDFKKVSMNFSADNRDARMYHIRLNSKDVELRGFFTLGRDNFVTSKLYLSLSKPILDESPRFHRIVKLMRDENIDYLRFDFQLSGLLDNMNFKWMESDFKNELRRRLPGFLQRRIEQGIEELLASPAG